MNRITLTLSLLAVAVAPTVLGPYTGYLLSLGLILATVAVAHSFLLSFGGQLSFAHGGLMGVGAYTAAIVARAEFPFPLPLVAAAAATAVVGLLMGLPSIRVAGHYLAMITLAAAVVLHILFLNLVDITGGPAGLTSIPRPSSELASELLEISPKSQWIWVCGVVLIGSVFLLSRLRESRGGLALMAIRENETAAVSVGIPANRLKLAAFTLSAAVAGLAGALFAHLIGFVSPDSFTLVLSIEILAMVIIGGIGSLGGAVLGAFLVTLLPEALRFGEDYRIIVFLLVLVAVLAFFPAGLAGLVPSVRRGLQALRARPPRSRPGGAGNRDATDAETVPDTEEDVRAAR